MSVRDQLDIRALQEQVTTLQTQVAALTEALAAFKPPSGVSADEWRALLDRMGAINAEAAAFAARK